jgi:hypothetical protein
LYQAEGEQVNASLTTVVILVTVIHVAAFGVMVWIRVRRSEADTVTRESANLAPCAVCGEPSTGWGYDGLDPNEQRDPHTGRAWSADMAHYRPVCTAH